MDKPLEGAKHLPEPNKHAQIKQPHVESIAFNYMVDSSTWIARKNSKAQPLCSIAKPEAEPSYVRKYSCPIYI